MLKCHKLKSELQNLPEETNVVLPSLVRADFFNPTDRLIYSSFYSVKEKHLLALLFIELNHVLSLPFSSSVAVDQLMGLW